MANYGGENYTNFHGVNLRNTAAIRLEMDGGYSGTLSVRPSVDADRSWTFPDKSGTLPIMGTFRVQLPATTADEFSTIVTVAGIRAEDALLVGLNGVGLAGTTYGFDNSTGYIIVQAVPRNGTVALYFNNPGGNTGGTGYVDLMASYVAMR